MFYNKNADYLNKLPCPPNHKDKKICHAFHYSFDCFSTRSPTISKIPSSILLCKSNKSYPMLSWRNAAKIALSHALAIFSFASLIEQTEKHLISTATTLDGEDLPLWAFRVKIEETWIIKIWEKIDYFQIFYRQ